MDRAGRSVGIDRTIAAEIEQPGTASVASPVRNQAGKGLISFGKPGWQRRLEFAIREWLFELTLPAKLDKAEDAWHAAQPKAPDPVIIEHPIEPGDSQLLGGAMEIKAPWKRD